MKTPLVNIIVVTFNEFRLTDRCIKSLLKAKYNNSKIYIVDNASEKQAYLSFFNKYKRNRKMIFIRLDKNIGFGGGCNAAIKQIKKGYIVFLNNDTEVDRNWLVPVIDYMEKNKQVGACQSKIKYLKDKRYFEYAGAAGGMMDVYGFPFARGRIFFTAEEDKGQYDTIEDLVWCSGTSMITRKSVLDKVGNFDEIFFMYGEEADLCWRINHAGYKMVSIPQSIVYHFGMGSMRNSPSYKKMYLTHRNGLILLLKNYTTVQCIRYLPIRFMLDFVALFYYLAKSPRNLNWFSLILAYLNIIYIFPIIFRKHLEIRRVRLNSKMVLPPLYKRSIVWYYFIKRKRKYSDLFMENHSFNKFNKDYNSTAEAINFPLYPRILKKDFKKWNEEMFKKYNNERIYNHPNIFIRYIERKRVKMILSLINELKSNIILAAGCGEGYIEKQIRNGNLTMVDLSKEALKRARVNLKGRNNVKFINCDVERMPFKAKTFDCVESSEVIEHVCSPEKFLFETRRVLKDEGFLIITFPNEPLINSIKKLFIYIGVFNLLFPNVPKDMTEEWHLHAFDLAKFKKLTVNGWEIIVKKGIPFNFFPLRYVAKCKKVN